MKTRVILLSLTLAVIGAGCSSNADGDMPKNDPVIGKPVDPAPEKTGDSGKESAGKSGDISKQ